MAKTIRQRVQDAFDDDDIEGAEKFLELTLSSWSQLSNTIGRTVVLTFLLAGAFEVLITSKVSGGLTLGPLTIGNTSLLAQFLPALIAYLVYDTYTLINQYGDQMNIYNAMMERFHPKLYNSKLPFFVLSPIRGPWSVPMLPSGEERRRRDRFDLIVRTILILFGFLVLPASFEFQAYFVLLHKYGASNPLVWISLAISLFFAIIFTIRSIMVYTD